LRKDTQKKLILHGHAKVLTSAHAIALADGETLVSKAMQAHAHDSRWYPSAERKDEKVRHGSVHRSVEWTPSLK
jgi:hypothetical protein